MAIAAAFNSNVNTVNSLEEFVILKVQTKCKFQFLDIQSSSWHLVSLVLKNICSPQLCSLALISDRLAEVQCSMIAGLVAMLLGK